MPSQYNIANYHICKRCDYYSIRNGFVVCEAVNTGFFSHNVACLKPFRLDEEFFIPGNCPMVLEHQMVNPSLITTDDINDALGLK